ncbi:hypothetical protein B4N89_02415 [Embleya scabrispora]|uniref:SHOCT domain-containing protein n=1 Tax=Embleya scabrispora TaxID=159449 RepID=A0A1T3NTJ8_9ACTN|nr:DUF4429 domain-containing protein [Embleya scabrispora]OPC79951.1 hypothetical protein B4N89_02415 [Embleya scabrispora]
MRIDPPLYAKGHNGQLHFDGEFVTITREGFVARSTFGKSEKRIHIGQVSAVQLKGSGFTLGYIEFTIAGGLERGSRAARQSTDNSKNENAVVFMKGGEAFTAIRDAVDKAIAEQHQAPAQAAPAAAPADMATQLRQLGELHAAGVLTDAEFTAAKSRLLG